MSDVNIYLGRREGGKKEELSNEKACLRSYLAASIHVLKPRTFAKQKKRHLLHKMKTVCVNVLFGSRAPPPPHCLPRWTMTTSDQKLGKPGNMA